MASLNRSRYVVTLGDGWRRHFRREQPNFEMLGEVIAGGARGALMRLRVNGDYYIGRSGLNHQPLINSKVEAALAPRVKA